MQEEQVKKDDLIDVGDADEKATEINLDEQQPKEEAAKEEEKVEVEQVEAKEEKTVEEKKEEKKDELKEYSDGVQKRIAKLTRKMREAERQREEAIAFAESAKRDKEGTLPQRSRGKSRKRKGYLGFEIGRVMD